MEDKFIYVKKVDKTTKKQFTIDKKLVKYFVEEYKLKIQAEKRFRDNTITPDEFLRG